MPNPTPIGGEANVGKNVFLSEPYKKFIIKRIRNVCHRRSVSRRRAEG